jgi:hypothetical protein
MMNLAKSFRRLFLCHKLAAPEHLRRRGAGPGAYYFMAAWWKKITGQGNPAEEHDPETYYPLVSRLFV